MGVFHKLKVHVILQKCIAWLTRHSLNNYRIHTLGVNKKREKGMHMQYYVAVCGSFRVLQ